MGKAKRKYRFGGASVLVCLGRWGGLHWHAHRRWQRIVVGWVSIWLGAVDIDAVIFHQTAKAQKLEKLLAYERGKASLTLNRFAAKARMN